MTSLLAQIIGQEESGNNPNASLIDYAGNSSVNAQFQQSTGYINQFGGVAGEPAILNQANRLLAANPNATLGDFFAQYNSGGSDGNISIPFSHYVPGAFAGRANLGANAANLNRSAAMFGQSSSTPLSSLVGPGSGIPSNSFAGGLDFSDIGGVPNITDSTFDGLTDEDITGGSTANASSADGFSLFGNPSTPAGSSVGVNASASGSGLGGTSLFGGDSTSDAAPALQDSDFDGLTDADIVGPGASTATGGINAATGAGLVGTSGTSPTGAAGGAAIGSAGGINVNLTDESGLPTSITSAGKAAQQGATTAGSDITGAAGGITGTAASIFNNAQTYASGAVIIVALVAIGLIFVAFGLSMFRHGDGDSLIPRIA
jgi:hypothetical protein